LLITSAEGSVVLGAAVFIRGGFGFFI
jgi:hypothetical protein